MTNDSKPSIRLSEENLQQISDAMAKAAEFIHQQARIVGRQAGESLVAISKRGSEWGGGR